MKKNRSFDKKKKKNFFLLIAFWYPFALCCEWLYVGGSCFSALNMLLAESKQDSCKFCWQMLVAVFHRRNAKDFVLESLSKKKNNVQWMTVRTAYFKVV